MAEFRHDAHRQKNVGTHREQTERTELGKIMSKTPLLGAGCGFCLSHHNILFQPYCLGDKSVPAENQNALLSHFWLKVFHWLNIRCISRRNHWKKAQNLLQKDETTEYQPISASLYECLISPPTAENVDKSKIKERRGLYFCECTTFSSWLSK